MSEEIKKQWEFLGNLKNMIEQSSSFLELKNIVSHIPINTQYLEKIGLTEETIERYKQDQLNGINLNLHNAVELIGLLAEKDLIICDAGAYYHDSESSPCCLCQNKYFIPLEKYLENEFERNIPPF